jgi:signal transduction histidine kinase
MRDAEAVSTRLLGASAALIGGAGAAVSVAVAPTWGDRAAALALGLDIALYAVVGLLILWRHPQHLVGRLVLAAVAVWGAGEGLLDVAAADLQATQGSLALRLGATAGDMARGAGWLVLVLVLPLVFPDGRRTGPPWLRRTSWTASLTAVCGFTTAALLVPTSNDRRLRDIDNPVGLPASLEWVSGLLSLLGLVSAVLALVLAVVTLVRRWRLEDALLRQRLAWFAIAFAVPVVLFPLGIADQADAWMFAVATFPVPVAIGVAVLQRRLYDVQLAVNRSITYGALSVLIAGLYAVVVGGVGAILRTEGAAWLPWVAAGVVAVTFAPLRNALQQAANKLTYGQWSVPAEVLADTGRRLADATDVPGLLHGITTGLADGLDLSYVEIADARGTVLARSGDVVAHDELPLTAYGVRVGVLRLTHRPLRDEDRRLVTDVAGQLGGIVHAAGLLDAVRDAQERLVLAREEERKRLRRDLHDGLGPQLAALALRVDTLRNEVRSGADPEPDLVRLRDGIRGTVLDVRRIVEGLRPPALDDLGLTGALEQLAGRMTGELAVAVDVQAPPSVPAAVEVAAYRIVAEALTNVSRHGQAQHARIVVRQDVGGLHVQVSDDGTGVVAPRDGGVGLVSMRERAEEIGGRLEIDAEPGRGTTVTAVLPLPTTTAMAVDAP